MKPFGYVLGALASFWALVALLIALTCTGLWHALATDKDSIDSAVKILGLASIGLAAVALFLQRTAESEKRALNMQRKAFRKLVKKICKQSEEFLKYIFPARTSFVSVEGLNETLMEIQIIAEQATVDAVMARHIAYLAQMTAMVEAKGPLFSANRRLVYTERALNHWLAQSNEIELAIANGLPHARKNELPAIKAKIAELESDLAQVKTDREAAWKAFRPTFIQALFDLNEITHPVVIALRRELGIKIADDKFLASLMAANAEGRKLVVTFMKDVPVEIYPAEEPK